MTKRIEDYAMLGDCRSAALVDRYGSVEWLCWPRFDSAACFAALLGNDEHGCWQIAPQAESTTERRYRDHTLILETDFTTADGAVRIVDCMPLVEAAELDVPQSLLRRVEGLKGTVRMRMSLTLRFDYGLTVPWLTRSADDEWTAIAGPDRVVVRSPVPLQGRNLHSVAEFTIKAGESLDFSLSYGRSHLPPPARVDVPTLINQTEQEWTQWTGRSAEAGPWTDAVRRSLSVLRGLTYRPTGGIVAAPTTSLPESIGGPRNWDYRYCWVRDATLTLVALMNAGYYDEAAAWRTWLLRAIAGTPQQLQIMYGIAGERLLPEREIPWLPGFADSKPVRVGNAASEQRQLDIYGEMMDAMSRASARLGPATDEYGRTMRRGILEDLERIWREPDEGIWEIRGEPQHFTHSKAMAWLAFHRAAEGWNAAENNEDSARWRAVAEEIHADICAKAYDATQGCFVQAYGSREIDASLLLLSDIGFLPADDPRIVGTVAAIEKRLLKNGLVLRYETASGVDGLPPGEGAFLACSFWLVDNYARLGRIDDARALFEKLLGLCNDVGLLAEEYDMESGRMLGNFPQAFSHVALINSAFNLVKALENPPDLQVPAIDPVR
jgi:GH15 family glucan-1,4-alpha-glucosidase